MCVHICFNILILIKEYNVYIQYIIKIIFKGSKKTQSSILH